MVPKIVSVYQNRVAAVRGALEEAGLWSMGFWVVNEKWDAGKLEAVEGISAQVFPCVSVIS